MTEELKFLMDAVVSASKIITDDFIVENKGDKGDLVTTYDFAVEKHIISLLNAQFPDFDIISEEFNSDKGLTENCFTIDPIDGTINFAHGLPCWVIQVACIKNGKPHCAVVYAPRFNEMYAGDKSGVYLNGKKVSVATTPYNKNVFVIEGSDKVDILKEVQNLIPHSRVQGTAGLNFAQVAAGKAGCAVFNNHTLWDYTPGLMLVQFAGGYVIDKPGMHIGANNKKTALLVEECIKKAKNIK